MGFLSEPDSVSVWQYSGAQVNDGGVNASPVAWTDLNLSAVVGAKKALVLLKIKNNAAAGADQVSFRTNGEGDEFYKYTKDTGVSNCYLDFAKAAYLLVHTDASGIAEWKTDTAEDIDVFAEGYLTI